MSKKEIMLAVLALSLLACGRHPRRCDIDQRGMLRNEYGQRVSYPIYDTRVYRYNRYQGYYDIYGVYRTR
jgi:hypothetical protein